MNFLLVPWRRELLSKDVSSSVALSVSGLKAIRGQLVNGQRLMNLVYFEHVVGGDSVVVRDVVVHALERLRGCETPWGYTKKVPWGYTNNPNRVDDGCCCWQ